MALVRENPARFNFAAARRAMIDGQLRVSGVNADFVRERMGAVAREDFVPEAFRSLAYVDRAIPLGNGRFLAAPLVQGMMLQEADPRPDDRALVIESGSGYLAELLRPLVGSLEVMSPAQAPERRRRQADATLLVIDGAIECLPDPLASRLAEGGRLVTGLAERGLTRLATGRKVAGQIALVPQAEIGIPLLPEFAAPRQWSF